MQRTPHILRHSIAALLLTAGLVPAKAATFTWNNVTGNWSVGTNWSGNVAPAGTNVADVLVFGGDVGITPGVSPNYTSTNNLAVSPFLLNAVTMNATNVNGQPSDPPQIVAGTTPLFLTGVSPTFTQNGAGAVTFNIPIRLNGGLTVGGTGTGVVTFNKAVSGFGDITKNGASTYRFGTAAVSPAVAPSDNTWIGTLFLNGGTFRFNNNAQSGQTAFRSNPVVMSTGTVFSSSSALRSGNLSGTGGLIESVVTAANADTEDIVLTTFTSTSFPGTVRIGPPLGSGNDNGALAVRGTGVQTLTGTMEIDKDVAVTAALTLAGTASLGAQTKGAILMTGGTFTLDNSGTNNNNRLRDGGTGIGSTGLDLIGGGIFSLSGNSGGTTETAGRLQLGTITTVAPIREKPRGGHVVINVTHRGGTSFPTVLTFSIYERDASIAQPFSTVEFTANDGSGTKLALGNAGANPRVVITTLPVAPVNGLLTNTAGASAVGWATTRTLTGISFATTGASGIAPTATTAFPATSTPTANALLSASGTVPTGTFGLNSLRIQSGAGTQALTINATGTLATTAILLSGANDYTITAGTIGGSAPRYFYVDQAVLTVASSLGTTQPLVKSGAGVLALSTVNNSADLQTTVINQGTLRATPGTLLPNGELRLRGGVLEITGGGTFTRELYFGATDPATGARTINWTGLELSGTPTALNTLKEDRGSGGFAAFGADASVTITQNPAVSVLSWEDSGFLESGYALILGSPTCDRVITFTNNLSVSSTETTANYNAREIRVVDNPSVSTDFAKMTGVISGTLQNDLLKTGTGTLELTNTNTYLGATRVSAGTLRVSGSIASSFATVVLTGGTLAGTGTVGAVLLQSGGRIAPGVSGVGTLTGGELTWKSGGICAFDLGSANAADKMALGSAALTKDPSGGTFAFDFGGTGVTGQTYTLATFGSTTFSAGDFTATNLASGVVGNFQISGGSLIFSTVQSPIDTWRVTYFGPGAGNSGNSADTADPDFDGILNLNEYSLGTNPIQGTSASLPATARSLDSTTFTFNRNLSATDVTQLVQVNSGLVPANWTTIATHPGGGSWTGSAGVTVNETGGGAVTVTDATNVTTAGQRFYRLMTTRP